MENRSVLTTNAPNPIGPYSQAIIANNFIFTAGQVPIDPLTGKMVEGDIQKQTRQALENIKAILEAGNSGMERVVKCTVFLQDLADFAKMNEVYATFFRDVHPARSALQVARIPLEALVEIEAVATIK